MKYIFKIVFKLKFKFVICVGEGIKGMSVFGGEKWGVNLDNYRNVFFWIKLIVFNYVFYMV